ncbi:MAG TPA: two-component regulator propeller domain-containing protein, partial [Prolixibacteraceae bacterium]|nr:two-component regulator propeller domain-containing protein [Prolixibacteraceae bacterium]
RLGSNIVRSLYIDSNGNVWVGTFDGLNVLSAGGEFRLFDLKGQYKPELKNNLVLEIQPYCEGNDSLLWVGTETGLVCFDRFLYRFTTYNAQNTGFGNEVVKCIFPLEAGKLYFGTDYGFYRFNSSTREFQVSTHDPFNSYSLANNVVWDLFRDNSGILWLATSNGISQLSPHEGMFSFTPVYDHDGETMVGNQVNDLYANEQGTLWLATKNGVLALYPGGKREVFSAGSESSHPLVLNNINTITGDRHGRIWIGSAGGINVWDPAQQKMHTLTADFDLNRGLRSNYISAFVTPPDGSFWVSTWGGGMYKARGDFSRIEDLFFEYVANFNTNVITANEKIWLKHEKKVYAIDLSTMQIDQAVELNEHIGSRSINALLMASNGDLWVGLDRQLLRYNPHTGKNQTIEIRTGNENTIQNLIEDHRGNIWGTTLTSVFRYNPENGENESYPLRQGIPLDIFLTQSNARDPSGILYFGGNDGFLSFHPDQIRKNAFSPRLLITDFKVNNKEIFTTAELKGRNHSDKLITFSDKIVLRYDQNSVSISFSALHFGDPKRNIYAYMLEGYDKEWKYATGNQNNASYSYLSPDKYRFIVKGTNNDGVWSDEQATLYLIVKPPFWASAWAIAVYIVLFQLMLISLVITYRNKLKWKEEIRRITLEKEKNEVLAQAKQQFFTNISHEFRTPLHLITGPVQSLIEKYPSDKQTLGLLQLISKNSRRLLSLINQLLDLRKIENRSLELKPEKFELIAFCSEQYELFNDLAHSRMIYFRFEAPEQETRVETDREKLESIVQNLLSNAFKFTEAGGSITLKLEIPSNNCFKISVADTGKGISEEEQKIIFHRFYKGKNSSGTVTGYGIGLNLAKEYCDLMKGTLIVESQIGKGSVFSVEIPSETVLSDREKKETQGGELAPNERDELDAGNLADPIIGIKPLILLVDDNPDTREYIRLCLSKKYSFRMAGNGHEALNLLEKHNFELIVSDIMMPEIDGISFCEKVKNHPRFAQIPLILLTAITLPEQQVKGLKAGADAYLTKPFSMEVLDARMESLLIRNQKTDEFIKRSLIIGNQPVTTESSDEKILKETVNFINEHISDPEINIDKMCRELGTSHSSLYRKVKSQTGMTLNELIRHVKMKKAAQLIKTKKYTIAEIMDETGFSSHSYFAKCFKNEFNYSPREYAEKGL